MIKCEISQCGREIENFNPSKPRSDGSSLIQILNTGRLFWICNNCIQKLGLVK